MSRGAPADVADDVVQEVAARVLDKRVVFDDAMDLMRWAVPVALNLLVDNARASARVTPVVDAPDQPVADVADLVAHRDRLGRVLRALPLLSAADRAALTASPDPPADRKEAVRLAVRRHRARRRLLALVDGVAAFAALVAGWARRTTRAGATATVALAATPVALLLSPAGPARLPRVAEASPAVMAGGSGPVRAAGVAVRPARPARVAPPPVARPAAAPAPARGAIRASEVDTPVAEVAAPGNRITVTKRSPERDGLVCVRDTMLVNEICLLGDDGVRVGPVP